MPASAELTAISVAFPRILRTNAFWKQRYPELVASAEEHALARLWRTEDATPTHAFGQAMQPFARDPFRGAVERRWRAPDESSIDLEERAARDALDAAGLTAEDIDLVLVASLIGERHGVGNSVFLAQRLGLRCPAFNFEAACASGVLGMHLADAWIRAGRAERVLVVASTSNSLQVDEHDTTSWFLGDGAAAMLFTRGERGLVGAHSVPTVGTIDMFVMRAEVRDERVVMRTRATPEAARIAKDTGELYLHAAVNGALEQAGLAVEDVDHWCFHTPNAWYAEFCGLSLGVPPERFNNEYHRYANIGAASAPSTLYHALASGQAVSGSTVGLFAVGSTASAAASILTLGEVALGPWPERPEVPDAEG